MDLCRRLWHRQQQLGIRKKLAIANTALFLLLVFLLLLMFQLLINYTLVAHTTQNAEQRNRLVVQKIEDLLMNAENISSLLLYNNNVQMRLEQDDVRSELDSEYALRYLLNTAVDNSSGISTIVLSRADGSAICTDRVNVANLQSSRLSDLFVQHHNTWKDPVWEDMHVNPYHIFQDEQTAVTLYRSILSLYTGQIIGLLTININETQIASTYTDPSDSFGSVCILDRNGRIISSNDKSQLLTEMEITDEDWNQSIRPVRLNGKRVIIRSAEIPMMDWRVVRIVSMDTIWTMQKWATVSCLLAGLITILIAAVAINRIIKSLFRPVHRLIAVMEGPENQILSSIEPVTESQDELGQLARSFSLMQHRIQGLIQRITHDQQEKTRLEVIALQTQITPHFLYNTLESVCALIQLERNSDALSMIKSLEAFYRGVLSKENGIIPLSEEIKIAQRYIDIQKHRYEGELHIAFHFSPAVLSTPVPKLTLQPLIENAIYHGLKNGQKDGLLEIGGYGESGSVWLYVRDNGAGFDSGRYVPSDSDGYGIFNIQQRLRRYFGEPYGLTIQSTPGEGTYVLIQLPGQENANYESFDCR